jgi:hypothetical protein
MPKWKLLATVFVAIAALGAVGARMSWSQPDRITRDNHARIHEGMNRAEVEGILGPPGDYRSGPVEYHDLQLLAGSRAGSSFGSDFPAETEKWLGETLAISVSYNVYGKVVHAGLADPLEPKPGLLDVLCWRVRRWSSRWFPEILHPVAN